MRIKTWKAWHDPSTFPAALSETQHKTLYHTPCRIVPEATWRKVMAVVREANTDHCGSRTCDALLALHEHERKRK